jgi:sirohydrochlorin ferrochelatase
MVGERPGLVIVAHGSREPGWDEPVKAFAADVGGTPGVADAFEPVQMAFLEETEPRVSAAVELLLQAGCPRILVAPLFLTVSTHLAEDLPAVLGLEVPAHVRQRVAAEGHPMLPPGLPIEILDWGPLEERLATNALRRLQLRQKAPERESVVLCAYGSSLYHDQWEALLHTIRMRLMQKGFAYASHAYVGHTVGMSPAPTREAIERAAKMAGIRRVHVIPLLVSVSRLQTEVIAGACGAARVPDDCEIAYAGDAILPDGDLAAVVGRRALERLGLFASAGAIA